MDSSNQMQQDVAGETLGMPMEDTHMTAEDQDHKSDRMDDLERDETRGSLLYSVNDVPYWYICILLGFQQFLAMFGGTMAMPLVLAPHLCLTDGVIISEMIGSAFFVNGCVTLMQTTFGTRLPIIQGATPSFLVAALAMFSSSTCTVPDSDDSEARYKTLAENNSAVTSPGDAVTTLGDSAELASQLEWQMRIRELQGGLILASLFEIFVGMFGCVGLLLKLIGPIPIASTIALVGLSLFQIAATECSSHWPISLLTILLIGLFSQFLRDVPVPCCTYSQESKQCITKRTAIFTLFPVMMSLLIVWFLCWILTITNVLKDDGSHNMARTDINDHILHDSNWFRFPYPFQWGLPTFTLPAVLAMLTGTLAGIVESIGDYYACARLSGAPPPPTHAVNRGITVEGIGCIIAGLFGCANGTTSYSENIAVIGITKVGSRRVIQFSGILMICFGIFAKAGALFTTMPQPIVGGLLMSMMGMISAVGISNLQYVNLNSSRNLFIFGFSVFFGLSVSVWVQENPSGINIGSQTVNNFVRVLLSTSMFVGGFISTLLDNMVPGTREERGMHIWTALRKSTKSDEAADMCYSVPLFRSLLPDWSCWNRCPISSHFQGFTRKNVYKHTPSLPTDFKTSYTSL